MVGEQTPHRYVLDNARDEAAVRLPALAALYDPGTMTVLTRLGISAGWRCLEIGAGGPSIPLWLAGQVGPAGSVLVTDINTRFLTGLDHAGVDVREHDITSDPLPAQDFDLVHSRLVLQHVGDQDRALAQMVAALKPGGWLVVEDFGSERVQRDPAFPEPAALATIRANCSVARGPGVRLPSLHRLWAQLHAHGLEAVGAEGRVIPWVGGGAGGRLAQANYRQRRADPDAAEKVTPAEFEAAMALLDDPATVLLPPFLWAVWGRQRDA